MHIYMICNIYIYVIFNIYIYTVVPSLKLTASLPRKINGWEMNFLLGKKVYFQRLYISFREAKGFYRYANLYGAAFAVYR